MQSKNFHPTMTLMSFKSFAMYPHNSTKCERSGIIIVFVVIWVVLMTALLLCNGIAMNYKYTNNSKNMNLENNNNDNRLMSSIQMMLLRNEFATTPNASNGNQKNNNKNTNNQQHYKINISADGNLHTNSVAMLSNNTRNTNFTLVTLPVNHQNRFVDEINIGNQHGVFNGRLTAINSTTITTTAIARKASTAFTMLATNNSMHVVGIRKEADTISNTSERSEMKNEYTRGAQQQETHEFQSNSELVLHRQKRYLVFPEGSSFQLVFDVIIGVVDYTSYAILGITVAVAWELPSKPPSELIENLHDKITEGLYTTSETKPPSAPAMRRNDSITPSGGSGGGGSSDGIKYGSDAESIRYVDNANMVAPTHINYGNMPPIQVVTAPPPVAPPLQNAMETAYYTHERQSNPFAVPITGYNAYKKVAPVDTRYYTTDGAYQPTNFYANARYNNNKYYKQPHEYDFRDKNEKSSYYDFSQNESNNNNNNNKSLFNYSAHGDSTDKQATKYTNRWQQHQQQSYQKPQHKKWQSWQDYDSNRRSYQQHQQKLKHAKWATQSKYVGTDNWWSRNKQHVGDIWRTKQSDLRQDNVRTPESPAQPRQPVMAYTPPAESLASAAAAVRPNIETAKGRSFDDTPRLLLTKPPKPRIYPIFGRRRRRSQRSSSSSNDAKLEDFAFKLERIHLREQLRTRQKLYGKIEKLYETRGLNGTACVLRALCETGQQQQKQQAAKTEPQSFITELLRAIFTLPTISINSTGESVEFEEATLHPTDLHIIDRTYREAQAQHDSCAQLFTMCEHSLWE